MFCHISRVPWSRRQRRCVQVVSVIELHSLTFGWFGEPRLPQPCERALWTRCLVSRFWTLGTLRNLSWCCSRGHRLHRRAPVYCGCPPGPTGVSSWPGCHENRAPHLARCCGVSVCNVVTCTWTGECTFVLIPQRTPTDAPSNVARRRPARRLSPVTRVAVASPALTRTW